MESVELNNYEIYTLVFVIISNLNNEVPTSFLDCILMLYYIKNTIDTAKKLRIFFVIIIKCVDNKKKMSFTKQLIQIIMKLILAEYQDYMSVITVRRVSVLTQMKILVFLMFANNRQYFKFQFIANDKIELERMVSIFTRNSNAWNFDVC